LAEVIDFQLPRDEIEATGAGGIEVGDEGSCDGDFCADFVELKVIVNFVPTSNFADGNIVIGKRNGTCKFQSLLRDLAGVDLHFFE
jgi:hypothetical protein